MNDLEIAAWEAHQFFSATSTPYAIIGGMAVQYWGEPRFTQDVDLTVSAPMDDLIGFIQTILDHFTPRIEDALEFARRNRVILVNASNGYPMDIALGLPGYEHDMMDRTIEYKLEADKSVRLCSAEDLIIHKAVAGRAQDVRDIEGIVYRQGNKLNTNYIRQWLTEFTQVTGDQEILKRFREPWDKFINS